MAARGELKLAISSLSPSLAEGNEKIGPLRFENKIRGAGSVGVNDSFTMNAKNTLGCSLPPSLSKPANQSQFVGESGGGVMEGEGEVGAGPKMGISGRQDDVWLPLPRIPTEYDIFVNG